MLSDKINETYFLCAPDREQQIASAENTKMIQNLAVKLDNIECELQEAKEQKTKENGVLLGVLTPIEQKIKRTQKRGNERKQQAQRPTFVASPLPTPANPIQSKRVVHSNAYKGQESVVTAKKSLTAFSTQCVIWLNTKSTPACRKAKYFSITAPLHSLTSRVIVALKMKGYFIKRYDMTQFIKVYPNPQQPIREVLDVSAVTSKSKLPQHFGQFFVLTRNGKAYVADWGDQINQSGMNGPLGAVIFALIPALSSSSR